MKRQYDLVVRGAPWRQLSVPHVLTCLQSANKWMAIGALLSGHARAAVMGPTWAAILQHYATAPTDVDIRETAQRLLGTATAPAWRSLPLTDMILFLKRMALYGSMNLEQLRTVAAHLTERDVLPGGVIFREGDLSHELYIIVSGRVDIVQQRTEALHTLATLSAGISSVIWPFLRIGPARPGLLP